MFKRQKQKRKQKKNRNNQIVQTKNVIKNFEQKMKLKKNESYFWLRMF